jgi:hypothetical protein
MVSCQLRQELLAPFADLTCMPRINMPTYISCVIVFLASCLPAAASEGYAGQWVVNLEETQAVAIPYAKGGSLDGANWRPNVSIMGIPLPGSQKMRPMSNLRANEPKVLRCASMVVTLQLNKIELEYPGIGEETVRNGHYRGRDGKFKKLFFEQKYKTPERKVTKNWSMRDDGRLLVEVTIKPVNDKKRIYRRVFDRAESLIVEPQSSE